MLDFLLNSLEYARNHTIMPYFTGISRTFALDYAHFQGECPAND